MVSYFEVSNEEVIYVQGECNECSEMIRKSVTSFYIVQLMFHLFIFLIIISSNDLVCYRWSGSFIIYTIIKVSVSSPLLLHSRATLYTVPSLIHHIHVSYL